MVTMAMVATRLMKVGRKPMFHHPRPINVSTFFSYSRLPLAVLTRLILPTLHYRPPNSSSLSLHITPSHSYPSPLLFRLFCLSIQPQLHNNSASTIWQPRLSSSGSDEVLVIRCQR